MAEWKHDVIKNYNVNLRFTVKEMFLKFRKSNSWKNIEKRFYSKGKNMT